MKLVRECQALARTLPSCTIRTGRRLIKMTLARFEPPRTPVEDAVLRGFEAKLAQQTATEIGQDLPTEPEFENEARVAESSPVVQRAVAFIQEASDRPLTTAVVARECACHGRKLERLFRQELGSSVHAQITKARLKRVSELLRDPEAKIGPLAMDIGFRSKSSLYRAVRKLTGTTPAELRRRSR